MLFQVKNGNGSLGGFVGNAMDRLLGGGTILEALLPPEQRQLVNQLQAVMSLLEGYSTHVMNAVGKQLLPHFEEIEERVEARSKRKSAAELLFLRLTGLQMKLDQYRLGNAFVSFIEKERGITFMNRVWDGPENLPSDEEIHDPALWIRRMERIAA
jgi:putative hydrolase